MGTHGDPMAGLSRPPGTFPEIRTSPFQGFLWQFSTKSWSIDAELMPGAKSAGPSYNRMQSGNRNWNGLGKGEETKLIKRHKQK